MFGFGLGCGIWGFLALLLAVWVYFDALEHGQNALLWLVLVFLFNLPALLIYFLFFRQGIAPPRRHRAVNRNADFLYRAKYSRFRAGQGGNSGSETIDGKAAGDPGFVDDELERLMASRRFSDAREYVEDMIRIAREMNDSRGVANYTQYKNRITRATMRTSGDSR